MQAPTFDDVANRYMGLWIDAPEALRRDGRRWYPTARREIHVMADSSDLSVASVTGIVAALSPQKQWGANLDSARSAVLGEWDHVSQTGANVDKAFRIAQGERPVDILSGPKVRAFYRALMGDKDAAVIDTWMIQAAQWHRDGVSRNQYALLAQALTECALIVGVHTVAIQATIWLAVRGR